MVRACLRLVFSLCLWGIAMVSFAVGIVRDSVWVIAFGMAVLYLMYRTQ